MFARCSRLSIVAKIRRRRWFSSAPIFKLLGAEIGQVRNLSCRLGDFLQVGDGLGVAEMVGEAVTVTLLDPPSNDKQVSIIGRHVYSNSNDSDSSSNISGSGSNSDDNSKDNSSPSKSPFSSLSDCLGRIFDPVGRALDGSSAVCLPTSGLPMSKRVSTFLQEQPKDSILTGVKMIDLLNPLKEGCSMLIHGPTGTGKSDMLLTAALAQIPSSPTSSPSPSVHVIWGVMGGDVVKLKEQLGVAMQFSTIIGTPSHATAKLVSLVPAAALSLAQQVKQQGGKAIVILDDLSFHAHALQEISLACLRTSLSPAQIWSAQALLLSLNSSAFSFSSSSASSASSVKNEDKSREKQGSVTILASSDTDAVLPSRKVSWVDRVLGPSSLSSAADSHFRTSLEIEHFPKIVYPGKEDFLVKPGPSSVVGSLDSLVYKLKLALFLSKNTFVDKQPNTNDYLRRTGVRRLLQQSSSSPASPSYLFTVARAAEQFKDLKLEQMDKAEDRLLNISHDNHVSVNSTLSEEQIHQFDDAISKALTSL